MIGFWMKTYWHILLNIGESGLVYRGYLKIRSTTDLAAIKTMKGHLLTSSESKCFMLNFYVALQTEDQRRKLLREVSIMLNFSHPNVMSLIGLCFDGETPFIIMPFMSKGSVLEYIRENRDTLYILDNNSSNKVGYMYALNTMMLNFDWNVHRLKLQERSALECVTR